jgi:hypothetical protein
LNEIKYIVYKIYDSSFDQDILLNKIIPKHIITNILKYRLNVNNAILVALFLIPVIFSAILPASYPSIATQLYGPSAEGKTRDIANSNKIQHDINYDPGNHGKNGQCISYDYPEKSIVISCGSVHLTDIANQINEQNVIEK